MPHTKSRSQLTRRLVLWSRGAITLVWLSLIPAGALTGHNPLLPRPQEIHYGAGKLAVRGLGIRLVAEPSAEDRFSAEHLSNCLSGLDRKSTRLNSSHGYISYAVFCLKKKNADHQRR